MPAAPAGRPLRCPAVARRGFGPTQRATAGGNFRQLPLRIALSFPPERGSVSTWVIAPRPRDRRRPCNPRSPSSSPNCPPSPPRTPPPPPPTSPPTPPPPPP